MIRQRHIVIAFVAGVTLVIVFVALSIERLRVRRISMLVGSVLQQDADPNRQVPLASARIIVVGDGQVRGKCESDSSGLFRLHLDPAVPTGDTLILRVEHANYQRLTITVPVADRIYIARMVPIASDNGGGGALIPISGIRVRYTEKITTTVNVGTIVKTFQVVNTGNVPCKQGSPCSPDGKWKSAIGGASFDAGGGNRIQNVRVSCIAGPCPFSRIENGDFADGSRNIRVAVRNWSDTVTYLVEAEVVRTASNDTVQHLYPVIFGRSMDFTLPLSSEGPSIEAEVKGEDMVFPLGPALLLSWAKCSTQTAPDRAKLYRCELKPGYRFQ